MAQGEQRLAAILDEVDAEGYERDDGEWIDPYDAQMRMIEEWFKLATDDEEFDVWSTVNQSANVLEGEPFRQNLRRICRSFHSQSEKSLEEVEQQIVMWEQEHNDDV